MTNTTAAAVGFHDRSQFVDYHSVLSLGAQTAPIPRGSGQATMIIYINYCINGMF